jgi:hypothetical protein
MNIPARIKPELVMSIFEAVQKPWLIRYFHGFYEHWRLPLLGNPAEDVWMK